MQTRNLTKHFKSSHASGRIHRLSLNSTFCFFYIACCALSFVVAYLSLNALEAQQLRRISQSTLFYAKQDQRSADLAEWSKTNFGMRTIDLLDANAGNTLYRLTGDHKVESPTLVLPQSAGGVEIASGVLAVEQALQPVIGKVAPVQLARSALIVMFGLILLALVFATEINKVVAYMPVMGLAAVFAMSGHCLSCQTGGSTLLAIAPILALAYIGAAILLFTIPILHKQVFYGGFLLASLLVPIVVSAHRSVFYAADRT